MKLQKFLSVASALTVASAITFTGSVSAFATDAIPVNHADRSTITTTPNNANARSAGTIQVVNESTALWKLSKGVKFDDKTLTVTQNGITEKLPTTATDKNGVPVRVIYQKNQSGIEIRTVLMYQDRDVWKCILGTGGGAILGGGSLGAAGVGVGTVFPGIGNVAGGVGGAIIGVIGGGMSGAAASCF
ncbi:hypothetical protein [Mobiluncus mulieris]|uniref:Uncharacterized protein n=1 Tax=Mobiluncus mulieris TaxID=2052 RepID=A0A7Y0U5Y3_9ACTO|nr:hypothetical protein [Mobiluncus mulieris]MCU9971033.1 hypothetical protein [Mobiluncus mulieris]MCU9973443.1 hypothetical protein [Mobiluncus mulieris]MCU9994467.1 hypothetical protein [Mobiluncus mulieris]MCU9996318.1 hypothetical protein [Mobiluncus mulieris]MCV0002886.1 hypothetical protein [Mobiluncus mulieris]